MTTTTQFKLSNRNKQPNGKWATFFYCHGAGFDTGRLVYYGKNEWSDEESAIKSQEQWENRIGHE